MESGSSVRFGHQDVTAAGGVHAGNAGAASSHQQVIPGTGMTMPAHCTAAGKAILASLPPAALEEYLRAMPAGLTPNSLDDPEAVRAEIARTAERGWATNYEESEDGLSAVAVAVPEPSGVARSSITVSLPAERLRPDRAPEVAAAATRSAQAIGARLLRAVAAAAGH